MFQDKPALLKAVRDRFAHVDNCPFQGPRIYFENGGGALTLKSVLTTSTKYAAIPDNQGRDNPASKAITSTIDKARIDLAVFMNTISGQFVVGETGTELLFRMVRAACLNVSNGSKVIGCSIEHPASRSAAIHWAQIAGMEYVNVQHNNETGLVTADDYAALVTPDVAVATILHASPVTGMGMDVEAIAKAIRAVTPDCIIIVDGIQHAAHGSLDLAAYDVDAYATISDVVAYFNWLGEMISKESEPRKRIEAAGKAIHDLETDLTNMLINGTGNLTGLRAMDKVTILGGADNPAREGTVSFAVDGMASTAIVDHLNDHGIRTHTRKADHYSGNILKPLNLSDCVRISMCHYNTTQEVAQALTVMQDFIN